MALRGKGMKKYTLYLAWLSSMIGTVLSLFLSEMLHWPICALCWYQRICLYPLAIILGIACFRSDNRIAIYALPLTLLGILFAGYQYLEQMIPGFSPIDVCGSGPSCSRIEAIWLGFITLPLVSMVGFVVISWLLALCLRANEK
ncbi:MAG: disulfide bond formation protein B [Gammaproteobacteria bacterium]|nr:disulfide bond formation protein B [Gammaproteobacteria bacterium]